MKIEEEANLSITKTETPKRKAKIKGIEEIKNKVKKIRVFEREKVANEKYDKISKEIPINRKSNNFIQHYLKIIELVFLNDTNKNIMRFYLKFIKINENNVKRYDLLSFDEEIKKYKLLFNVKEMKEIKEGIKNKSEKNNFIELLEKLSKIIENDNKDNDNMVNNNKKNDNNKNDNNEKNDNKNKKSKNDIKKNLKNIENIKDMYSQIENDCKQIKYFNYPIEFSNQELFYYKLYSLLIKQINQIYKDPKFSEIDRIDYMINKYAVAKLVLDKKILYNDKIINDENKMNLLILYILYDKLDDKGESINFNRLLQTEDIKYQDLINYIKNNNIGALDKIQDKNEYYLNIENVETIKILENNNYCKENLGKEKMDYINDIYKYNNLDSLLKKNEVTPYLERIKKFLVKIINSNVYKEAIRKLFPEYNNNLLDLCTKDLKKCIESRFQFYPYQDLGNSGVTDKFSCYSYICVLFDIFSRQKKYYNCLRCGAIVYICFHELNHINQNILYFLENNENLFHSPKREGLEEGDGGQHLEEILFGGKIVRLRILECFYILNENNYNQSLTDFRSNFKKLYNNSINYSDKINYLKNDNSDAIFKEFFSIITNFEENEFKGIELFGIITKGQNSGAEASIILPKKFCKMG